MKISESLEVTEWPMNLWREVINRAGLDAIADNRRDKSGTERIYKWSKSADCKEVCYLAQLDHDVVRIGFIRIYLNFLKNKLKITKKDFLKKDVIIFEEMEEELKKVRDEIEEVYERWDKIIRQEI